MEFVRSIGVSAFDGAAVIAGENDEGIFTEVEAVEGVEDLADRPIELLDHIPPGSALARAAKARMRDHGFVDIVGGKEDEKWGGSWGFEKFYGLSGEEIGDVFIDPAGGLSAGHEPNTRDAIDDRIGVVGIAMDFEDGIGVPTGGIGANFFFETDLDGILGIVADHRVIFDEDAGDAVAGGGDKESGIEAEFERAWADIAVINGGSVAEAEVPFSDESGGVTGVFEESGKGESGGGDEGGSIAGGDARAWLTPRVATGEEGEACGGANGGTGVGVGEADAIFGEAIDVWGEDMGGAVATKISVADIVGEDVEDIGERAWGLGGLRGRGEEEEKKKGAERRDHGRGGGWGRFFFL